MSALPNILVHSSDAEPGLTRRVRGRGFSYHFDDGSCVEDAKTLDRIGFLGLPPAYKDVWICALEHGHLQATGRDDRGRKQYRYHDKWREYRDRLKFEALIGFGEALPALRARVRRDLSRETPDLDFVCASLVRLMDRASLRVGNATYAQENGSYGATTLLPRHVKLTDEGIKLDFKAKGGKRVRKRVSDKTLHRVLSRIEDLPGAQLFHYIDEGGEARRVDSADVNAYIGRTGNADFTAKTFRTWRGSVEAFAEACDAGSDLTIKAMCLRASEALHNTPTICRSSYIHPDVIALAEMDSEARQARLSGACEARQDGLRVAEAGLLAFLNG